VGAAGGWRHPHCARTRKPRPSCGTPVPHRHRPPTRAQGADRAEDLLNRDFTAPAPNPRWIADFTYVRTWAGFVYVAFIVDVFAQRIVGWHAAADRRIDLVLTPLRIAPWDRTRHGHPVTRARCSITATPAASPGSRGRRNTALLERE
jgi:transposase InsO family protein